MPANISPQAMVIKSDELAAVGDLTGAIARLKTALETAPHFYTAWLRLGRRLYEAGHFVEAMQVTQAAEQCDPCLEDFRRVQRLMRSGAYHEAERAARRILALEPGHVRAISAIAEVAKIKNYPEGQVAALALGLRHSPANRALRKAFIDALEEVGDYQGAVDSARTLVALDENFDTLWIQIGTLLRLGQNDALMVACDKALVLCLEDKKKASRVQLVRGQLLRVLGKHEESVAALRAALEQDPDNAGAWWTLADLKTYEFSSQDQAAIKALVETPTVPRREQCLATFALAKACERQGDWDATMNLYHKANQLSPDTDFEPKKFAAAIETQIRSFTPDNLSSQADRLPQGPTPIFILGLPRSGSTLVEQILASHSLVEGTVEQPVLPSIKRKAHVACAMTFQGSYFANHGDLSGEDLTALAAAYISDGALFRSENTPFFTDKLPFNFLHIGLIHKLFPHAPIIDIRRNPLDCGFSLYKQYFVKGSTFSYDLEHIGRFYNGYLKLMDYWEEILPNRIVTVHYETLVANPEQEIRALVKAIHLPFESACLNFHQTNRAVRTASSEQVRRPINTDGIGAWRRVRKHLRPLENSLGADTLDRFADCVTASK